MAREAQQLLNMFCKVWCLLCTSFGLCCVLTIVLATSLALLTNVVLAKGFKESVFTSFHY